MTGQTYYINPAHISISEGQDISIIRIGNVGIKALIEPMVPVPSMNEQEELVTEIESHLSVCDSIEQTVDKALQQAKAMRQSILKQAFEGRL